MTNRYSKILYMGKSLGTSAICGLIEKSVIGPASGIVLLTPGNEWPRTIAVLERVPNPVLVIGSLQDKYFPIPELSRARQRTASKYVILEHGNHSLETATLQSTLDNLRMALEEVISFLVANARK